MKTILVPTDFSEHAAYALRVAATIAKKKNATLLVAHMVGIKDSILTREESDTALESIFYMKLTEKRFAEFLDKDYLEGIEVQQVVKKYKVFSELNEVANENNASLIVMGSHGSSGFQEVLVGSNTEKVVRTADVPVLIIKNNVADFDMTNGVFACDYQTENIPAYKKAKDFFSTFDAQMNMAYINTPGASFKSSKEIDNTLFTFFEKAGEPAPLDKVNEVAIFNDYTVEEGIFSYSQLVSADIISIPTHGRKGIAHFFSGSIGEDIANHAAIPVLTIKL